jgi:hypothetical protein
VKLYNQWKSIALGNDQHVLAVYEQTDSWTLGYNLFADVWLGTNLVDSSVGSGVCWCDVFADNFQVYDGQSSFIDNITLTSGFSNFGMPVDNLLSDTTTAVSSWCFYHVLNLFG